jgi:hypothetical protein
LGVRVSHEIVYLAAIRVTGGQSAALLLDEIENGWQTRFGLELSTTGWGVVNVPSNRGNQSESQPNWDTGK